MTRLATPTAIVTIAIIATLLAVIAINLIQTNARPAVQINSRPSAVDNGWREPAWFPPAQPGS